MLGRHQTGSERLVSIQKAARQVVDSQQRHHTVRRQHIAAIVSAASPLRWSFWLNAMVIFSVWWTKMTARCLCSVQHRRNDRTIWCWDASSNTSCWTWSNWASRSTKACKSSKMRKSAPAWSHAWSSAVPDGVKRRKCVAWNHSSLTPSTGKPLARFDCKELSMSSVWPSPTTISFYSVRTKSSWRSLDWRLHASNFRKSVSSLVDFLERTPSYLQHVYRFQDQESIFRFVARKSPPMTSTNCLANNQNNWNQQRRRTFPETNWATHMVVCMWANRMYLAFRHARCALWRELPRRKSPSDRKRRPLQSRQKWRRVCKDFPDFPSISIHIRTTPTNHTWIFYFDMKSLNKTTNLFQKKKLFLVFLSFGLLFNFDLFHWRTQAFSKENWRCFETQCMFDHWELIDEPRWPLRDRALLPSWIDCHLLGKLQKKKVSKNSHRKPDFLSWWIPRQSPPLGTDVVTFAGCSQ